MSEIKEQLLVYYNMYKKWVINNPKGAAEMETIIKFGSYFLVGRFNSSLFSEFVYTGSRLFEMFNDFLVRGALYPLSQMQKNKLEVFLTIVEYIEVLVEVGAAQTWGEVGRWAVVSLIQLLKAIGRLILLFKDHVALIGSPPIKPLDRRASAACLKQGNLVVDGQTAAFSALHTSVVRLEGSGRMMRTLEAAPPPHLRTFVVPDAPSASVIDGESKRAVIRSKKQLTAEIMHILRPLGHLGSLYIFGEKSWKPWLMALGMDVTSLHLHGNSKLNLTEQRELTRRRLTLLYYLLRSPAFHMVTHRRLNAFLMGCSNHIPLASRLCQPLVEYLPQWQKIYAYTWR